MWMTDLKNKQKYDPLVHVVTVLQRATHKIILATKRIFFFIFEEVIRERNTLETKI